MTSCLVGEHGGKTSWGLHTSQDGSWSTPLYRNPSGVSAAVCSASSPSTDFLQDWDLDTGSIFSLSFVTLVTCFGSLTCCKTRPQPVFSVLAKGRSRSLSVMKPCCGLIASSPRPELFRCSLANLSQALQDFMSPWHGSTSADLWS